MQCCRPLDRRRCDAPESLRLCALDGGNSTSRHARIPLLNRRGLSYDPDLIDLIKERPMPRTPRASSYLLAAVAASTFVASANLHVSAQRASQGVVVPDDPIWAAQEPQDPPPAPAQADADPAAGRGRGAGQPA